EAKDKYKLAFQIYSSMQNKDEKILQIIGNLGNALYALKEFDESLEMFKQGLAIHKEIYGEQHEPNITFIVKIASCLV
ncbi:tetratricopeptide repeat protein, partial [Klebsiella pneumoniae]|uniref:tetratricopeptide repeat protein n=1 Tax=Klebsiella pneumoniae TaxID=573 RepID=UPI003EE308BB